MNVNESSNVSDVLLHPPLFSLFILSSSRPSVIGRQTRPACCSCVIHEQRWVVPAVSSHPPFGKQSNRNRISLQWNKAKNQIRPPRTLSGSGFQQSAKNADLSYPVLVSVCPVPPVRFMACSFTTVGSIKRFWNRWNLCKENKGWIMSSSSLLCVWKLFPQRT